MLGRFKHFVMYMGVFKGAGVYGLRILHNGTRSFDLITARKRRRGRIFGNRGNWVWSTGDDFDLWPLYMLGL